jgi:radical SAM superfamily enzyme YgiQ (UPF0313 family)
MTQLNTPYPATAYLTGFLRKHRPDVEVRQADAALGLFLRLYSREGMAAVLAVVRGEIAGGRRSSGTGASPGRRRVGERPQPRSRSRSPSLSRGAGSGALERFVAQGERYVETVEAAVRFLQGRDPSLALRIVGRGFLPEGPRFGALSATSGAVDGAGHASTGQAFDGDQLEWAFGALGLQDQAKYLASLFVDDVADVLAEGVDPRFGLSRYGERLAASAASFDGLRAALDGPTTLVDDTLDALARGLAEEHRPDLLGLTVPFPGNAYGALRMARAMRLALPGLRVAMGGGYVNTELRQLSDPRIFDDVDFITLDDGERPFLALLDHLDNPAAPLFRTFVRRLRGPSLPDTVALESGAGLCDVAFRDIGTPSYAGLPLGDYVSLLEMLNPMHRLWSDGRWNKLTVAHGCYWKKCTFCDVSLDYIARYEAAPADELVDRIEALVRETGQTGFHFVDEAAPPAALRALAERLIARRVAITWWGNIRFEKTFDARLTALLARSGCVAVSGGLEVASDRLLALMKKGVTVEQVARVTRAFTDSGIMVHAYLMYGFPTETEQETIDALERVRQLFEEGCIQSAFWHRFAATAHSPIGLSPGLYGIRLAPEAAPPASGTSGAFARNDLAFVDPVGCDHDALADGLRKAVYNYMHGLGLERDVRKWFALEGAPRRRFPAPQVDPGLVRRALSAGAP